MTENPTGSAVPPHAAPPHETPQSTSFLDDGFSRLRQSGFHREGEGRWFGGVCSGLAAKWQVDPVLIRAAAVVLAFVGGIGITAYLVLWLLMPDRRAEILAERAVRHGDVLPIILLVVAVVLVFGGVFSIGNGNFWTAPLWLVPIGIVAWFVLARGRARGAGAPTGRPGGYAAPSGPYAVPPGPYAGPPQSTPPPYPGNPPVAPLTPGAVMSAPTAAYAAPPAPPYGQPHAGPYGARPLPPGPPRPIAPPPPRRPRRRRPSGFVALISIGTAIVGFGLGALLDEPLGFPGSAASLGFAMALVGVSAIVLTLGLRGRASGFSGFLVIVLGVLLLISSAVSRIEVQDGVGERTWTPVPASGSSTFQLGAGDATLDLSRFDGDVINTTPQRISVEMGAGDLTIIVPTGADARIEANVGFGSIRHTGSGVVGVNESSGSDRSTSTVIGDEPVLVIIDAQLGLGQITIEEQ
ncbi:MAG: PspC domain-containing protein [Ornithinibacter sp.]